MDTHRTFNLKIKTQNLGNVFIEPSAALQKDIESAKVVIYPAPIPDGSLSVAVEWAAGTQVPFFCHTNELEKLKAEGFGTYRFQKLDSFKEVDFLAGSIEFFPSREKKQKGARGFIQEIKEIFGVKNIPGFHLILKPRKEQQVLYLSHPFIDHIEWGLLTKGDPLAIVGSSQYSRETWQELGQRFRSTILYSKDVKEINTIQGTVEFVPEAEAQSFNTISQSTETVPSEKILEIKN